MKKIDNFIKYYSVSKTLRFSLLPVGSTEENFNNKLLLEEDKERAVGYDKVKSYIDDCHRQHIESVLSKVSVDNIDKYAELYYKSDKSNKEIENMKKAEAEMRETIANNLKKNQTYKALFSKALFSKDVIQEASIGLNKDEIALLKKFDNFTTYFYGFFKNRENVYSSKENPTSVAYRCINVNLPKFLYNVSVFKKIKDALTESDLKALEDSCMEPNIDMENIFSTKYFNSVLSQSGIDKYNAIIGGSISENNEKIQGLNERINLYNQNNKAKRLPLFQKLYKQILSDKESASFIPEKFSSDNEVLSAIKNYCDAVLNSSIKCIGELFSDFDVFDLEKIYITSGSAVTNISNAVLENWSAVSEMWNKEYEEKHPLRADQNIEKYYEAKKTEYKKIKSFSLAQIEGLLSQSEKKTVFAEYPRIIKMQYLKK